MRNKKLALLSLILAILATFSLSALAACSNSQSSGSGSSSSGSSSSSSSSSSSGSSSSTSAVEDEISITLPDTATVVEYESVTLTPTVVGEGDIVWSTSNDAVATVNDGVVYGVKAGEATITAAIGEKSASCTVSVTATPYFHELVLSDDQISMKVGDISEEITVSVTFNGEPLTVDGLEYVWAPVGTAATVASVSSEDNGATATFTALTVGDVEYTVSATVRGYLVSKNISVKVLDNVITLQPTNESLVSDDNGYAASLVLGNDDTKSLTIGDINVLKDGASKGTAEVVWAVDDSGVVSVANGVVTALKAGTAVLTGSVTFEGKDLTVTLTVTVAKGKVTLENTITVETVTSKINVPAAVVGNVEKITIGGSVITSSDISVSGGELTVADGKMPVNMEDLGENKTVVFETAEIVYTVPANVYTMIIDTKAEFDSWQEVACDVAVAADLCSTREDGSVREGEKMSGYFVMAADIDYNGTYTPKVTFNTYGTLYEWKKEWGDGSVFGFKGVFDGKGHTVSGMTIRGQFNAFVTTLSGGTIKNVSFVNAGVADGSNFIAAAGTGTIENIYVKYSKITNSTESRTGTIYCNYQPITRVSKNIVIDITDCAFDKTVANTLIVGYDFGTFENVVVIGEVPAGSIIVGVNSEHDNLCLQADSYADLFASTAGVTAAAALTEGGFFTSNESIILPAGLMTKHGSDVPALTEGTETSIEIGSQLTLSGTEYCTYSLVNEVTGVAINGKTISVGSNATVGAQIVVKATSLVSGEESEFTFTVAAKSYVIGTAIDMAQVTVGALVDFGLSSIWNKSIEDAAIEGATGKVAKFRNNEEGMNAHGATVTFNEPLSVQSGLNFVKLRMYAKVESGTLDSLSLRFYRSDRTSHQVEPDVWMDASAAVATNEWVNIYLDVTKFTVGGKVSGFKFGVFTAGDVTLYIDGYSGESNAYTLGDDMVESAAFSISGAPSDFGTVWGTLTSETVQASDLGVSGASGNVLKLSHVEDIRMQYAGIKFNNPLYVSKGYNYVKIRMYIASTTESSVSFRVYRLDRPNADMGAEGATYTNAFGDTITTPQYYNYRWDNMPVNEWIDNYVKVSDFVSNDGARLDGLAFCADYKDSSTNAVIYIDGVSVEVNSYVLGTEANWNSINLTGAPSGFGLGDLSCEKVEASTIADIAATASGKIAKFGNGSAIQYLAGFVKFQAPVTVLEGYNYVKVRLYAVSSGNDAIGFRLYKTDRPTHGVEGGSYVNVYGETVTTEVYYNAVWENVAVNQWVDLYLNVDTFKVSTIFEGFGFMCDRAGVTAVYIDSISIVSTNE